MTTSTAQPTLITRRQAAERIGVSVRTIDRALSAGRLKKFTSKKNDYNVRVDAAQVDELLTWDESSTDLAAAM